jgi:hypothetical protein
VKRWSWKRRLRKEASPDSSTRSTGVVPPRAGLTTRLQVRVLPGEPKFKRGLFKTPFEF